MQRSSSCVPWAGVEKKLAKSQGLGSSKKNDEEFRNKLRNIQEICLTVGYVVGTFVGIYILIHVAILLHLFVGEMS